MAKRAVTKTVIVRVTRPTWKRVTERAINTDKSFPVALDELLDEKPMIDLVKAYIDAGATEMEPDVDMDDLARALQKQGFKIAPGALDYST